MTNYIFIDCNVFKSINSQLTLFLNSCTEIKLFRNPLNFASPPIVLERIKFGLNTIPYVWSLTFDVSETVSDTIESFLEARAEDGESFDWQPPGSAVAYKWICLSWRKRLPFVNRASLSMTFQQVFEP